PQLVRLQIPNPLVYVRIDGMVRFSKIPRIEKRLPHVLRVVTPDRIRENRYQVIDSEPGRFHQDRIVQRRMHIPRVDQAPAVTETIRIITFDMETLPRLILENRNGIVSAFDEKIHGLGSQQCCIETIEQNRPTSTLSVADLSYKDSFPCRGAAAIVPEI